MALKLARKPLIPATLTVKGQGDDFKFDVTFHNRKTSEVVAKVGEADTTSIDTILFMVESWNLDVPLTRDGLADLEDERPGMLYVIIEAFHDARRMTKEKN